MSISSLVPYLGAQGTADWSVSETEERRQEIIRRYRALLESRPEEGPILDRLLQEVGGGRALERLIAQYESLAQADPASFSSHMILGHLYKRTGRYEAAQQAYQRAAVHRPNSILPHRSLGLLLAQMGRAGEALQSYLRALDLATARSDRQTILFALADLAFAQRDFEAAVLYFEQIIELSPRDIYLRNQLIESLMEHGRYEEAAAQYNVIIELTGRDTGQRALNVGAMGDLLVLMGNTEQAVERYRQAQRLTTRGSWLWDDLEARVVEAHRAAGELEGLLAHYEHQWRRPSAEQLRLLAQLNQELGREERALELYREVVRRNPRSSDARLDLIQLLERMGNLEGAITGYRELLRYFDEPLYRFRLAELLRQNGDQAGALELLLQTEARHRNNANVLSRLAEYYLSWGRRDRARAIHEHLVRLEPADPYLLIALGEYQFMDGEREAALESWQRLLQIVSDGAQAQSMLGRVLADHGFYEAALSSYQSALEVSPDDVAIIQAYAETLEEARRFPQAIEVWSNLSRTAADRNLRSEARSRMIAIHRSQGTLREQLGGLRHWQGEREAGILLGEMLLESGEVEQAELVFLTLLEADFEDLEVLLALAGLYENRRQLDQVVATLEIINALEPEGAGERYMRMAELSLARFADEDAIAFAGEAVALNPHDPRGHAHLAEVYRRSQRYERAESAYLEAIRLDRRGSGFAYELGQMYQLLGRSRQADQLYREIVRYSRDGLLVRRAGERSIQINQVQGSLPELLLEWESQINRPLVHEDLRHLLVEVARRQIEPLVRRARWSPPEQRVEAVTLLESEGVLLGRVLQPILRGDDHALALSALRILAEAPQPTLVSSLSRILANDDPEMRRLALLALARIGSDSSGEAVLGNLRDDDWQCRLLAAWALGRSGRSEAVGVLLTHLQEDRSMPVRMMAAIALGELGGGGQPEQILAMLANTVDDGLRLALVWALGAIGDHRFEDALLQHLVSDSSDLRRMAVWSLAQIEASSRVVDGLLRVSWSEGQPEVREASIWALLRLSGRDSDPPGSAVLRPSLDDLTDPERLLSLSSQTRVNSSSYIEPAFVASRVELLAQTISEILEGQSSATVWRLVRDLDCRDDGLGLGPLFSGVATGSRDEGATAAVLTELGRRVAPDLLARLLGEENPAIRVHLIRLVGKLQSVLELQDEHLNSLAGALRDSDPAVRRAAATVALRDDRYQEALLSAIRDEDCLVRAAVYETLGGSGLDVQAELLAALDNDGCLQARGGAARGLAALESREAASALIMRLESSGEDPLLRIELAEAILMLPEVIGREALERLRVDRDPRVRAAVRSLAP